MHCKISDWVGVGGADGFGGPKCRPERKFAPRPLQQPSSCLDCRSNICLWEPRFVGNAFSQDFPILQYRMKLKWVFNQRSYDPRHISQLLWQITIC